MRPEIYNVTTDRCITHETGTVSCLFDINECALDLVPPNTDRNEYLDFLYKVLATEMPAILGD